MDFKSRKLYVWLISAGAILVIYLLYNLVSKTPLIKIDTPETSSESDAVEFDSKIGKVGDVGIGPIQKAQYTHLDAKKRVDREFGFEKLLHAEGNAWEIEKPYMNIFRHNLKCYMTADKGTVRVEDAVGRATPTDATLTGNVVVHILPDKNSKIKESFIYLDDVIFVSEKSMFSSAGPVKFTSPDAHMLGKGMELVYNDELDRLEFLKIINLESLRIKQSSKAALFSSQASDAAGPTNQVQTNKQEEKEASAADNKVTNKRKGEYYKCVFRKNVIIDCPEQVILTDEISVNDILWSKGPEEKPETLGASDTNRTEVAAEVPKESTISSRNEPNESPEKLVEIVVTCDNGITVVPMDSPILTEGEAHSRKNIKSFTDDKGRPVFIAQRIDYSLTTEAVVATKPSELTFYTNDIMGTDGTQTTVPVKITAREKAAFLPKLNQVVFEGDVVCSALRENIDFQQKYTLSAPKLTVDLSKSREAPLTGGKQSRTDIKHLTATGRVVQLDTSKWTGEKLLGFTKLKCPRFDYDATQQIFLATGPGIIAADNSKITVPRKKTGKFSLQRPCTAVVQNFDTLKYSTKTNIVIADGGSEQIRIDYFPVVKGRQEQQTTATANYIEAALYETADGRTELSTLNAKGGITYEEQKAKKGRTVQFVGSEMVYDGAKSMITAWGDESQPCFLNGALAPGIEYNLKKDRIKTKIVGPGMLQMGN